MGFYRDSTDGDEANQSRTASDRRDLLEAMDLEPFVIDQENVNVEWFGSKRSGKMQEVVDNDLISQVVWELYESNFRRDVESLHAVFQGNINPQQQVYNELAKAFASPRLLNAPLQPSELGHAAVTWKDRVESVHALAIVMHEWPGTMLMASDFTPALFHSGPLFLNFEKKVASDYCAQWVRAMKRKPIGPVLYPSA